MVQNENKSALCHVCMYCTATNKKEQGQRAGETRRDWEILEDSSSPKLLKRFYLENCNVLTVNVYFNRKQIFRERVWAVNLLVCLSGGQQEDSDTHRYKVNDVYR